MLYIVMYHYTRDLLHSRYPKIKGLDLSLFRQQIDFFLNNFSIVTMEEVIAASTGATILPPKALLLTFDDGYIDHYTSALPILEAAKIKACFFIPGKTFATHQLLDVNKIHYILASAHMKQLLPDVLERIDHYRGTEFDYPSSAELFSKYAQKSRFDTKETIFIKMALQTLLPEAVRTLIASDLFQKYVGITEKTIAHELYMSADQIRMLKRCGHFIGIHGYDHYWLENLSVQQMHADIAKALDAMNEFINLSQWVMCYPYGSYNTTVIDYIKGKGACLGLTTNVGIADLEKDDRLALPRLDCNDFPPKSENYKRL